MPLDRPKGLTPLAGTAEHPVEISSDEESIAKGEPAQDRWVIENVLAYDPDHWMDPDIEVYEPGTPLGEVPMWEAEIPELGIPDAEIPMEEMPAVEVEMPEAAAPEADIPVIVVYECEVFDGMK